MIALLIFLLRLLVLPSRPKRGLEAENAALRRQPTILVPDCALQQSMSWRIWSSSAVLLLFLAMVIRRLIALSPRR
jgi:hypothetical protein